MTTTEDPSIKPQLWVRSDVMPNGQYGVGLSWGEDRAWVLNRKQALQYSAAVVHRAIAAEHDAAVWKLMIGRLGMKEQTAVQVLVDVRAGRGIDHSATAPLQLVPAVGLLGPFIRVDIDGVTVGQLRPAALKRHGLAVLEVLAAVQLDSQLHRVLLEVVGVDDHVARSMIDDLSNHWPAEPEVTR